MNWKKIAFLVAGYLTTFCNAAAISKPSKFSFPPNMIGLDKTGLGQLRPILDKYEPIDLGIDILDDQAPMFVRQALANATLSDDPYVNQQDTRHHGIPRLRKAIANMYSPLIGHELDPDKNVLVTEGATAAVFATFEGHTFPRDEWVIIEPAYTIYAPMIQLVGGVSRFTSLKVNNKSNRIDGEDWVLDRAEIESLFNEKTKGILLNNPLNPVGKVYTRDDLEFIASLVEKYDAMIVSDEAHEWITHKPHIRIASLPGMFERTITIGTATKAFSVAGYRIGWAYGPSSLLENVKIAHEVSANCATTPNQEAVAYAFEQELRDFGKPDSYFVTHLQSVKKQRDMLTEALDGTGMTPVIADSGFCLVVNWTGLKGKLPNVENSMKFMEWLAKNVGVMGYPLPAFYGDEHKRVGDDFVRFCYHKKISTLEEVIHRLNKMKILVNHV